MGREVRRVPAGWRHPEVGGICVPLHDGFGAKLAWWEGAKAKWAEGLRMDFAGGGGWVPLDEEDRSLGFEEWYSERPDPARYVPDWPVGERTHWQMYEVTSEGTPISPVIGSAEELERWLAEHECSATWRPS